MSKIIAEHRDGFVHVMCAKEVVTIFWEQKSIQGAPNRMIRVLSMDFAAIRERAQSGSEWNAEEKLALAVQRVAQLESELHSYRKPKEAK